MPYRVLVVHGETATRSHLERILAEGGNFVASVSDFEQARERLLFAPPDVLVTAVRLGRYNGLHLVVRARTDNPDMPAVVIDTARDPVLEREAREAGALYVDATIDDASLLALINRQLAGKESRTAAAVPRKWARKRTSVPASVDTTVALVVDVSYGGLRLELRGVPGDQLTRLSSVYIPNVGILPIHPVWARGVGSVAERWWCGAEVSTEDARIEDVWRWFVDSVGSGEFTVPART